jgi:hypothetical protein
LIQQIDRQPAAAYEPRVRPGRSAFWCLRFSLSYREVAERGLWVDHVTIWRSRPALRPESCSDIYIRGSSRRAIVGASIKPTYGSKASGATCVGRRTPAAPPSTFSFRPSRTRPRAKRFQSQSAGVLCQVMLGISGERNHLQYPQGRPSRPGTPPIVPTCLSGYLVFNPWSARQDSSSV